MKLWKKVYLLTLIVITICVNIGFGGIIYFTYEQMLESEKNRCISEFELLRQGMSSDIAQMEQSIQLNQTYFERYIKAYDSYYDESIQVIGVVKDMVVGEMENNYRLPRENGLVVSEEGATVIYVSQILDQKHSEYRIILRRDLIEFDSMWEVLYPLYIGGGIILSLSISLVLAFVVRMMLKPLEKLESAAKLMQEENWSTRVEIRGNDEITRLGIQFNAMADSVEENINVLEQQSVQKQQLINNLAHEMNTPITSIRGFTDYMRITEISKEEQEECLGFIANESKRLKEISATLLQMAQLGENDNSSIKNVFSMKNMCERLNDLYSKSFADKKIEFNMHCEVEKMQGNEVLIESLLRNLITNAYRAIFDKEDGHIDVNITYESSSIKIEVSDNGCGIDETHLVQIFEPFYRVDKERSRENGGSGLGLAFCKKIVELHRGEIKVETKVNEGTKFTVFFTESFYEE